MPNQMLQFSKCQFGTVVFGNQNVFNVTQPQERYADVRYVDAEDVTEDTSESPACMEPDTTQAPHEASKDLHMELFKQAMLQVQDVTFSDKTFEKAIHHAYDWYAALRLGKELGVLGSFEELKVLMHDERFKHVPKGPQNFADYVKYIERDSFFPEWTCNSQWGQPYLMKYRFIGNQIYTRYEAICHDHGIEPYGK